MPKLSYIPITQLHPPLPITPSNFLTSKLCFDLTPSILHMLTAFEWPALLNLPGICPTCLAITILAWQPETHACSNIRHKGHEGMVVCGVKFLVWYPNPFHCSSILLERKTGDIPITHWLKQLLWLQHCAWLCFVNWLVLLPWTDKHQCVCY